MEELGGILINHTTEEGIRKLHDLIFIDNTLVRFDSNFNDNFNNFNNFKNFNNFNNLNNFKNFNNFY